jgi:CHAT domain-containing protein
VGRFGAEPVVRLGADASEAFVKRYSFRGVGVVHFATHAVVDEWDSDRSALALTPGQDQDGRLTPREIGELELPVELSVLSACRTASGPVVGGEGIQGLAAPLIAAGSRAVLATLWPIRDRATEPFVEQVYRRLAAGDPLADALRAAKLAAIRNGAPPSDWAPFVALGDPLVRVPLLTPSEGSSRWPVSLAGAGLVLVIALGMWIRRSGGR